MVTCEHEHVDAETLPVVMEYNGRRLGTAHAEVLMCQGCGAAWWVHADGVRVYP